MIMYIIPENVRETDGAAYPYSAAERMQSATKAMLIIFVDRRVRKESYRFIYQDGPLFILLVMNRLVGTLQFTTCESYSSQSVSTD